MGNHKNWASGAEMQNTFVDFPDEWALRGPGFWSYRKGLKSILPWFGYNFGPSDNHPRFGYERSWVYATRTLVSKYRKTEADWSPYIEKALKDKIRMCIRAYASDVNKVRFMDKSQSYTLKIPLLAKCLKRPKFILVLRNPYAMCWREVTRRTAKYQRFKEKLVFEKALRLAAEHWGNTYRIALSDLAGHKALVFRFEDFLISPRRKIREILEYVELDYRNDLLSQDRRRMPIGAKDRDKWYPISENVNERYLSEISSQACQIVHDETMDIAKEYDYRYPC
jgi:hypothetical protein